MSSISNGAAKPLIGLTGRRRQVSTVEGFPDNMEDRFLDVYLADYSNEVLAAGGLPVNLPMGTDPREYAAHLDGVLLTGGSDVHPARYGATPDGNGAYELDRDELELALFEAARAHRLPVVGICRGLQVMNVGAGGSLHQHVVEHSRYDVAPDLLVHEVSFEPDSVLAGVYDPEPDDAGPHRKVNSLHHQTVDRVGDGLRVVARSADGTIEGLESEDGSMVAVQWHPEMLSVHEPVFDWLVARARERADHG